MPSITLDTITLDGDLVWVDEFQWGSIERSSEYSLTGAVIVSEAVKLAGRPITLEAKSEFRGPIWMSRTTVEDLYAKAATPNLEMTLTLSDNREFTVMFRDEGITAEAVYHVMAHEGTDPYYFTLKLMTV
jgi:hypothetical protein